MIKYRNRILVPKLSNIDRGPVFGNAQNMEIWHIFFLFFYGKATAIGIRLAVLPEVRIWWNCFLEHGAEQKNIDMQVGKSNIKGYPQNLAKVDRKFDIVRIRQFGQFQCKQTQKICEIL